MTPDRIDWSQLWYPGPTREFTEAELARAGGDRPSRSFVMVLLANVATCLAVVAPMVPRPLLPAVLALSLVALLLGWRGAMWVWARPDRRRLLRASMLAVCSFLAAAVLIKWRLDDAEQRLWLAGTLAAMAMLSTMGYWALAHFRAHQIEARLRELAERERAVAMARHLATAQIQPHFLFNSLASLQHWVDTGDPRAGPMLASLTGYLRAVLPLFQREQLPLGEELEATRRYLEVMQARLGGRLRFTIEADAHAPTVRLPPGLLLTLVENAVQHGVEPSLHGAELWVRAQVVADRSDPMLTLEVSDSGAGLVLPLAEGTGLANTRERLAQAHGARARLTLAPRPEGGTIARIELPVEDTPPCAP